MLNKLDCCFARPGKLLKLLISKATESSRKRSINKRLEPAAVLRSTCPQMSVAKF